MKKIIALFAALTMLLGIFMLPLSAQDAAPSLDDSLVVYYDFEGDTLEEQLSDKATAGVSKENLTFIPKSRLRLSPSFRSKKA